MKLVTWTLAFACLGIGASAVLAAPGCTTSTCAGSTCTGNFAAFEDAGGASVEIDAGVTGLTGAGDSALLSEPEASTPPDSCNQCLYSQCVGAYSDCVANSSCLGIYQCAVSPACAADGGSCVTGCYDAGTPSAQAVYAALIQCEEAAECGPTTACAAICNPSVTECTTPDEGGIGEDAAAADDSGTDSASLSCGACQSGSCASQLAACASGTPCATYNECVLGCTDVLCTQACATDNPSGAATATALGSCTATNCASLCQ